MADIFMPRILKQAVTYWAPGTADGFGGTTYGTATALLGRWEEKLELFVNQEGKQGQSTAQVYVGQDLVLGGYLYMGTSSASTPPLGAWEIRGWEKVPNLAGTKFVRRALL